MKIGIEAQRIFRKNKHGMDFVILEAIKELIKIDPINEYYIFIAKGDDKCLEKTYNMHIVETPALPYPIWEQIALPYYVNKYKIDILHCTSNTAPIFSPVPLYLTLHDVIFMEKREYVNKSLYQNIGWYYRKFIVPLIIKKCKKVITVSNYENKRIRDVFSLPKDKVVTIYNGYNKHFNSECSNADITGKYIEDKDYIFVLGNTDPKKNTARILKAYSLYLKESKIKLPMLLADISKEYVAKLLEDNNIQDLVNYIRYPGYIKNSDLPYIYSAASMFVYASLRESFGIPILEAMACGTAIITSNTSAIPEIAGEQAILINPLSETEISNLMLKLENDPNFKAKKIEYGIKRVMLFSWENTAKELLNIYKSK